MKQKPSFILHMAALTALAATAGCQGIQPRGTHGSLFGGKTVTESTPTEGELVTVGEPVVQPGQTNIRVPAEMPTAQPSIPTVKAPATPAQKDKVEPPTFAIPAGAAQPTPVHARDIKVDDLPKPVSNAEPMKTAVPAQPAGAPALPKIVKKYTVEKGDTFGGIAQKHGLTTSELARVNSLQDVNRIRVGQTLNIPEAGPRTAKPAAKKATVTAPEGGSVYTVKSGDYIGKIAHQHGLKTGDVLRANNLTEEAAKKLHVGQKIIIPAKNAKNTFVPSKEPAVKAPAAPKEAPAAPKPAPIRIPAPAPEAPAPAAPTLKTPAPAAPAPVIPAPAPVAPAPAVPAVAVPAVSVPAAPVVAPPAAPAPTVSVPTLSVPTAESRTYVVQEGDDLLTVAKKHNTTKLRIMTLNNISDESSVKPGQVLKVR